MTQLRELMTADPVSISPETSLVESARLMKQYDVGILPVAENGNLVGIMTDRDLVIRGLAAGDSDAKAGAIMSRGPVTATPDTDVQEAERLMAEHGVRRLPVCNGTQLVGMISVGDLAVRADEQVAGEVMEETGPQGR